MVHTIYRSWSRTEAYDSHPSADVPCRHATSVHGLMLVSARGISHKRRVNDVKEITVAVFEDQPEVLEATRRIFASSPGFRCVHAALSLDGVEERILEANPDVVILDVMFEGGSGLEALATIRQARPLQPVVMHTVVDSSDEILLAYLLGASGYILKGDGRSGILHAVEAVADGGAIFSPRIAWSLRQMTLTPDDVGWMLTLTPTELDVLDALSQGLTAKEVAAQRGTAVGTINKQCEAIRRKAELRSIRHVVTKVGKWASLVKSFRQLWDRESSAL